MLILNDYEVNKETFYIYYFNTFYCKFQQLFILKSIHFIDILYKNKLFLKN
jgi:hypothetical protein